MNDFAFREMRKMDLELDKVIIDLEAVCDQGETKALQQAQAKWLAFRDSHAEFVWGFDEAVDVLHLRRNSHERPH